MEPKPSPKEKPSARLERLGIELPPKAQDPVATYVSCKQAGDLLYVSGQGPIGLDGTIHKGKVGAEVSREQACEHARLVGLNMLAAIVDHCGTLDRVAQVVKLLGLVNAAPDFTAHPYVINGCSKLLIEVFGDEGQHARSAIGAGSLPNNITVEIEGIFELRR